MFRLGRVCRFEHNTQQQLPNDITRVLRARYVQAISCRYPRKAELIQATAIIANLFELQPFDSHKHTLQSNAYRQEVCRSSTG